MTKRDDQEMLRAQLAEWLFKAQSLERSLLPLLELQAQRAEGHPELEARLRHQAIGEATLVGDEQTASLCRQIVQEEHEMSAWLAESMPEIIRDHLASLSPGDDVEQPS